MKGYSTDPVSTRNLANVEPMRFNLLVMLRPEQVKSAYIITPEKAQKDHTRGWVCEIVAQGALVEKSAYSQGLLVLGTTVMIDESVSIDDGNRAFDDEAGNRCLMLDMETVMGVLRVTASMSAEELNRNGSAISANWMWTMLGDRVLVELPQVKESVNLSNKSLIVPEMYRKRNYGGKVIAVGRGVPKSGGGFLPLDFKPDDYVLFPKFGGTDIILDDKPYVVIRQDKILAKLNGEIENLELSA